MNIPSKYKLNIRISRCTVLSLLRLMLEKSPYFTLVKHDRLKQQQQEKYKLYFVHYTQRFDLYGNRRA